MQVSTLKPCIFSKAPWGQESDMYVCESFGVLINKFYHG